MGLRHGSQLKHLPCKYGDLSQIPRTCVKPYMVGYIHNPHALAAGWEAEMGESHGVHEPDNFDILGAEQ